MRVWKRGCSGGVGGCGCGVTGYLSLEPCTAQEGEGHKTLVFVCLKNETILLKMFCFYFENKLLKLFCFDFKHKAILLKLFCFVFF